MWRNYISLKTYTNNSSHLTTSHIKRKLIQKLVPDFYSVQIAGSTNKATEAYRGEPHQIMCPPIPPSSSIGKA